MADLRDYSPEAVDGAIVLLAALRDMPEAHRLDALALAAKAYVEKPGLLGDD